MFFKNQNQNPPYRIKKSIFSAQTSKPNTGPKKKKSFLKGSWKGKAKPFKYSPTSPKLTKFRRQYGRYSWYRRLYGYQTRTTLRSLPFIRMPRSLAFSFNLRRRRKKVSFGRRYKIRIMHRRRFHSTLTPQYLQTSLFSFKRHTKNRWIKRTFLTPPKTHIRTRFFWRQVRLLRRLSRKLKFRTPSTFSRQRFLRKIRLRIKLSNSEVLRPRSLLRRRSRRRLGLLGHKLNRLVPFVSTLNRVRHRKIRICPPRRFITRLKSRFSRHLQSKLTWFPRPVPTTYFLRSRLRVRRYGRLRKLKARIVAKSKPLVQTNRFGKMFNLPYVPAGDAFPGSRTHLFFTFRRETFTPKDVDNLPNNYIMPMQSGCAGLTQHSLPYKRLWSELITVCNYFQSESQFIQPAVQKSWFTAVDAVGWSKAVSTPPVLTRIERVIGQQGVVLTPSTSILVNFTLHAARELAVRRVTGSTFSIWNSAKMVVSTLKGIEYVGVNEKLARSLNKLNLLRRAKSWALSSLSCEFIPQDFWTSYEPRYNLRTGSRQRRGFQLPSTVKFARPCTSALLVAEVWNKEDTWNWNFANSLSTGQTLRPNPSRQLTKTSKSIGRMPITYLRSFLAIARKPSRVARKFNLSRAVRRLSIGKVLNRNLFSRRRVKRRIKAFKLRRFVATPSNNMLRQIFNFSKQSLSRWSNTRAHFLQINNKVGSQTQLRASSFRNVTKKLLKLSSRFLLKSSLRYFLPKKKNIWAERRRRHVLRSKRDSSWRMFRKIKYNAQRLKWRRVKKPIWKNRLKNLRALRNSPQLGFTHRNAYFSIAKSLESDCGHRSPQRPELQLFKPGRIPNNLESILTLDMFALSMSNRTILKYMLFAPELASLKVARTTSNPSLSTTLETAAVRFQNQLATYNFESRANILSNSNLTQISKTSLMFRRKLVRLVSNAVFTPDIIIWYYKAFVHFAEVCTGRKVAVTFGPFAEKALTVEDFALCYTWDRRLYYFQRLLGHRIFAKEGLRLTALSLRLKDPHFLANWLRGMLKRMSFWKYRVLFRYLKFLLKYLLIPKASHFGFKGFKLKLKGKISVAGNARTRTLFQRFGYTSHSQFSNKIAYDLSFVNTFTGIMGFRIWFFY